MQAVLSLLSRVPADQLAHDEMPEAMHLLARVIEEARKEVNE